MGDSDGEAPPEAIKSRKLLVIVLLVRAHPQCCLYFILLYHHNVDQDSPCPRIVLPYGSNGCPKLPSLGGGCSYTAAHCATEKKLLVLNSAQAPSRLL